LTELLFFYMKKSTIFNVLSALLILNLITIASALGHDGPDGHDDTSPTSPPQDICEPDTCTRDCPQDGCEKCETAITGLCLKCLTKLQAYTQDLTNTLRPCTYSFMQK